MKYQDIIDNLRELARYRHDDLSVGFEGAYVIEELLAKIEQLERANYNLLAANVTLHDNLKEKQFNEGCTFCGPNPNHAPGVQ